MKRAYKKNRAKARSSYQTYSDYYDKVSKKNPNMYEPKYNKEQFNREMRKAHLAKWKNPSTRIVQAQRKWEYQFSRRYESLTGNKLTGNETKEERQAIFQNFIEDEFDGDYEAGREFFEQVMY